MTTPVHIIRRIQFDFNGIAIFLAQCLEPTVVNANLASRVSFKEERYDDLISWIENTDRA